MADKLVQLKDKAGNHIFPIAKGLAELSVGTSNIKNQAVNSSKIANTAVTTEKLADLAVTTGKLAAGAVSTAKIADGAITNAKIGNAAVKSSNLDWSTLDTGWIDCGYTGGYGPSSNGGWKKLQARILNKILYLRGGVSPTSGSLSSAEVEVAILPSKIFNAWVASDTSGNYPIEIGRAASGNLSTWTINPTRYGTIAVFCSGSPRWASVNLEYAI